MSNDPRETIERAARQHHEEKAKATDPLALAEKERDARCKMLEESLWESSGGSVPLILAVMVMLSASMVLSFVVIPIYTHQVVLGILGGVVSVAVSFFGVMVLGSRALTAWHAGAVRRIGHGFDAEAYLELLSRKRRKGRLVATLLFDNNWDEDLRRSTADAVRLWCPDLKDVSWESDRALRLQTVDTKTVQSYRKSRRSELTTTFTNYPLHRCMKCITRKVLPQLDAVHPVTRIEVGIVGEECAFDAKP